VVYHQCELESLNRSLRKGAQDEGLIFQMMMLYSEFSGPQEYCQEMDDAIDWKAALTRFAIEVPKRFPQ